MTIDYQLLVTLPSLILY